MKRLLFMLLMMLGMSIAYSQTLTEKMKPFATWIGEWRGEGSMRTGPGPAQKSSVHETIQAKLEGSVLLIEGIGKVVDETSKQENVVHHALAVLSFDQVTQQYKIQSYLKDGRSTLGWFTITGNNTFQWGFEGSWGKMRYTITLDDTKKTWSEFGEYSRDGETWMRNFEMLLTKQ